MENIASVPVSIRPYIGVRHLGKSLCLYNLKRRESWVFQGSSSSVWQKLSEGQTAEDIGKSLGSRYNIPPEKIQNDVLKFVENLWQRQIVDIPGREDISDEERASLVTEEPHNKNAKMYEAALDSEVLAKCIFDLLVPCNLRCRHCYLDFSETDIMPFNVVTNYLDQLADHGCPELVFTGGEIFLRRDLLDIVAYAERKGFSIILLTNGNFITKEKAKQLSKFHLDAVQISLYGTTADLHEAVTLKPGTYDKSINGARYLVELGVHVNFLYFVQQHNFEDAFRLPEFADNMGATYSFETKLVPNRNGSVDLIKHGVSLKQQAELYRAGLVSHESKFVCTAAVSKARITAKGDVLPCELINTVSLGNLQQKSLSEIWDSQRRVKMRQDILGYKPNRCGSCTHTSECEPCAAMRGFNQDGHMEAPVSEACLLTTASLLSRGKELDPASPFREYTDDCVQTVLSNESIPIMNTPLVQIIRSRASGN
ncbi:MAG TPA: PqqD family peptide modification chaperone [Blastocatellia bacterium]|nr:PqqD family peptide modification chaperone [Blastocatellia bacterium]